MNGAPLAFRVKDFCQRIGISPSTFWKFVGLGKIKVIRVGGRTLVPTAEAERIAREGLN
jgi:predicted site-specific integrase-resolvase